MRHGKKISVLACVLLTACAAKKNMQTSGIDVAGMDKSVAPGDDFNAYTNGGWIKATPIPADKSSYGNFTILLDKTRERTRELIENASKSPSDGEARKVGDFYASFMDESGIEATGAGTVLHRRHQGPPPACGCDRQPPSRRRRSAEQHQFRNAQPFRRMGDAGSGRSVEILSLFAARRPRPARPRLLPFRIAAHGRASKAVSGPCGSHAEAGRPERSRRARRARIRPGNRDGEAPRHARRIGGCAHAGFLESRRFSQESSGTRLDRAV